VALVVFSAFAAFSVTPARYIPAGAFYLLIHISKLFLPCSLLLFISYFLLFYLLPLTFYLLLLISYLLLFTSYLLLYTFLSKMQLTNQIFAL